MDLQVLSYFNQSLNQTEWQKITRHFQHPADSASAEREQIADEESVALQAKSKTFFGTLPATAPNEANPSSEAKVLLGYTLYFDNRLSKDGNISCNNIRTVPLLGISCRAYRANNSIYCKSQ